MLSWCLQQPDENLQYGALAGVALDGIIPSSDTLKQIPSHGSSDPNSNYNYCVASAAAIWPGNDARIYLQKMTHSSNAEVAAAAQDSLNGNPSKFSIM